MEKHTFKKGVTYELDRVYKVLSLIPLDTYEQDDISEFRHDNGNTSGEEIKFVKTVTIKYSVTVT